MTDRERERLKRAYGKATDRVLKLHRALEKAIKLLKAEDEAQYEALTNEHGVFYHDVDRREHQEALQDITDLENVLKDRIRTQSTK